MLYALMNDRGNRGTESLRRIDRARSGRDSSVFPLSFPSLAFASLVSLSPSRRFHPDRVRAFVVFRRCCWRKVESTWGRVASMAPAANGRAALQTLISCRFRGPSRFYLSASKSAWGPLLFSLRPFSSRRPALLLSPRSRAIPASDLHGAAFDEVRYLKFQSASAVSL